MPKLGEIKQGHAIGRKDNHKYIYVQCPDCGKNRWAGFANYAKSVKAGRGWCRLCASRGERNYCWKGGKVDVHGYKNILLPRDSFFQPMTDKKGYVKEHRLVKAQQLDRNLQRWEIVHHKNGNKLDNREENLELSSFGSHSLAHSNGYKDGFARGLRDGRGKQVIILGNRIKCLERRLRVCEGNLCSR